MNKKYQELFKQLSKEKETSPSSTNDHIMLFDGLNTFIRSFSATPSTNEDGDHIGGISGFLFSIGKAVRDFKPSRCIIVFDGKGGSQRRKKVSPTYKANRANKTRLRRHDHSYASLEEEQQSMHFQFSRLVSYLDCLPVTFLAIDGIEADDTIAYIANHYEAECKRITIVSTDRDFYQMVSDKIHIWSPVKKKLYDVNAVIQEFGVHPINYVVYRSFTGDKSDNIEGLTGFGTKTINAAFPELAEHYDYTIEYILEKSKKELLESKKPKKIFQTIQSSYDILEINSKLMDLKLFDISAAQKSTIRDIIQGPIPTLDKNTFRQLFMEDKMWTTMKNLPDWLNNTWLALNAFAMQYNQNN